MYWRGALQGNHSWEEMASSSAPGAPPNTHPPLVVARVTRPLHIQYQSPMTPFFLISTKSPNWKVLFKGSLALLVAEVFYAVHSLSSGGSAPGLGRLVRHDAIGFPGVLGG